LEQIRLALLLLDLGFHAEVEGGKISSFLALRKQNRDQSFQPVDALAMTVCGRRERELGGCVGLNEWLDELEGSRLLNGSLDLFVRYEGCDGQTSVVLDGVVVVKGEREEPDGDPAFDHGFLILGAAVHGHVCQCRGAVTQCLDVGGFALVDDRVQTSHGYDVAAGGLTMLEEVFEDAGADSGLINVANVVSVLLGHCDDFIETLLYDIAPKKEAWSITIKKVICIDCEHYKCCLCFVYLSHHFILLTCFQL